MKEYYINQLRDRTIGIVHFREASASLSKLIALEVSLEVPASQRIILVPILRAGLSLLAAFQDSFIESPIGFIGIKRDEKTALPAFTMKTSPNLPRRPRARPRPHARNRRKRESCPRSP